MPPQPKCKHVHIKEKTKTAGTSYVKGWCSECKAFVYTDKSFCICCMKRVKHKTHHLWLKRILNQGVRQLNDILNEYEKHPIHGIFCEIMYNEKRYHIPVQYLLLYKQNKITRDMLPDIQDSVRIAK